MANGMGVWLKSKIDESSQYAKLIAEVKRRGLNKISKTPKRSVKKGSWRELDMRLALASGNFKSLSDGELAALAEGVVGSGEKSASAFK